MRGTKERFSFPSFLPFLPNYTCPSPLISTAGHAYFFEPVCMEAKLRSRALTIQFSVKMSLPLYREAG